MTGGLRCSAFIAEYFGAKPPGFLVTVAGTDLQRRGDFGSGTI
jgi:hypothetical protein